MAKSFYKVKRAGLTVGNVIYRQGDIIEIDSKQPNLSRASAAFMKQVEHNGGHEFLEPIDGRTSEAKKNSKVLPLENSPSGVADEKLDAQKVEDQLEGGEEAEGGDEDPLVEDEETDEE